MDCFVNVEQAIAKKGCRAVYGWAVWQVPGNYIEAEFHYVWQIDAGEMMDVTQHPYRINNIRVLPDITSIYKGQQVDIVHQALVNVLDVIRWFYLI